MDGGDGTNQVCHDPLGEGVEPFRGFRAGSHLILSNSKNLSISSGERGVGLMSGGSGLTNRCLIM